MVLPGFLLVLVGITAFVGVVRRHPLSKESQSVPMCSLLSIHVESSEFIGVILNDEFVQVAREFLQVILR